MRIERIEAIAIEIPLPRRFAGSVYAMTTRCAVITRIATTDGLVSEVYNGDNREHGREIVRIITEEIAPLIIGEDAIAYERIWEKAQAIAIPNRDRKLAMEAIACVDTAIWDLLGKRAGLSVRQLLGGSRTEMPIISIGGYYAEGKTLLDLAKEMAQLRDWGMGGCKVKVGSRGRGGCRTGARRGRWRGTWLHDLRRCQSRLEHGRGDPLRPADRGSADRLVRGALPLVR